ncbi:MAG TPA: hypothetical protein VN370_02845 [Desulfitobacteriaceae bacterium]|nr:hypothetical protein [Desulfitobacteriaceae bacterium]
MKVDRGRYKCKENHFRGGALSERNGAALRSAVGLHADYPKGFGTLAAQWSEQLRSDGERTLVSSGGCYFQLWSTVNVHLNLPE